MKKQNTQNFKDLHTAIEFLKMEIKRQSELSFEEQLRLAMLKKRQESGLSLSEISRATPFSLSHLQRLETGREYWSPDEIITINNAIRNHLKGKQQLFAEQ